MKQHLSIYQYICDEKKIKYLMKIFGLYLSLVEPLYGHSLTITNTNTLNIITVKMACTPGKK
jgi:hypothetical protein